MAPNARENVQLLLSNLASAYNPDLLATASSMTKTGKVYTAEDHIGNGHNREGINCQTMETVRSIKDVEGDLDKYALARFLGSIF